MSAHRATVAVACPTLALAAVAGLALAAADSAITNIQSVSNITSTGAIDGRRAYSFGLSFCNPGTVALAWQASTPNHGVSSPNLYRLSNGRLEQIGIGWCAHEFFALSQGGVCGTCPGSDGSMLPPGCMTPTSQAYTMSQQNLAMRASVNAFTGSVTFPFDRDTGPALYKRLHASESDLSVAGASYFVEQATIHQQDAEAGTPAVENNYGYRPLVFAPGTFNASFSGAFVALPAIYAWRAADPAVQITVIDVPGEGRFLLGAKAAELGGGQWGYEYALQNLNSDRAAGGFSIPVGASASVAAIGFHDVDYHSGEPYDNTDWSGVRGAAGVSWSGPQDFAGDPNSNALRWGTLYNFRFVADAAPAAGDATITLFKPGTPGSITASTIVPQAAVPACPGDADGDGLVGLSDVAGVIGAWGALVINPGAAPDFDASGVVDLGDIAVVITRWGMSCR